MYLKYNANGFCYVNGMQHRSDNRPSYICKLLKGEEHYTSFHWIDKVKESYPDIVVDESSEYLFDEFKNNTGKLLKIKNTKEEEFSEKLLVESKLNVIPWLMQRKAALAMASSSSYYLADDVGLGKTISALLALIHLKSHGLVDRALIVTTNITKYQWLDELNNITKTGGFEGILVTGDKEERKEAYSRDKFIYITNYESLLRDYPDNFMCFPFQAMVLDEAWKVKNSTTKINKLLKHIGYRIKYKYALNGTPMANKFEELFGVFNVINPFLFLSWNNFSKRYVNYELFRLRNGRRFNKICGYKNLGELQDLIDPYVLRRCAGDVFTDRPSIGVSPYWVNLNKKQRVAYDDIAKNTEMNPLEKTTYARVACLSSLPMEDNPKAIALIEILKEVIPEEKTLIFSESKKYLILLLNHLKSSGIFCDLISGDDSDETRLDKIAEFRSGNIQHLLMTAAGESGISLHPHNGNRGANIVINLDLPWSPARLQQRVGRVRPHLKGNGRAIRVFNIMSRHTIEEKVIVAINKKIGHFSRFFNEDVLDLTGVFDINTLVKQI